MAEGSSSTAAARAPPAPCCGLARLVRRLRRQGRRALCAASHSHQPRRHRASSCRQYDPLSYARNFDLGRDADDADAARIYYACSFSSRFALVPATASSSSSAVGAAVAPAGLPVAATS
ncbi:unnamed protein product [Miscanthus lutarioriparius]|uniref:Uncharacterized protein n=1 Tax=Miscanthus lutarioriparius TaxID=422564 RepID=A0A811Q730_9POAL|nr:unnamed protein product [Miscanthus lutarioriparius]